MAGSSCFAPKLTGEVSRRVAEASVHGDSGVVVLDNQVEDLVHGGKSARDNVVLESDELAPSGRETAELSAVRVDDGSAVVRVGAVVHRVNVPSNGLESHLADEEVDALVNLAKGHHDVCKSGRRWMF